jgi:O-antigen/teichoic acid export membrane protein
MEQTGQETRKFTKDILWMTLSLGLQSLISIVTVPILTKTLHTELYGVWVQITTTAALIVPLTSIGLDLTYIRFMADETDKGKLRIALGTVIWPVLMLGSLLLVLSIIFKQELSFFIFDDAKYASLIPPAFILIIIQTLFTQSFCYFKALRNIKRVSIIQICCIIVQMSLVTLMAIIRSDVQSIVFTYIGVQGLFTLINLWQISSKIGFPSPKLYNLKKYLLFSIPLLPSSILFWIINSSDRYLIAHFLNVSQVGIYSVSYSLANLCYLIVTPIAYNILYVTSGLWEKGQNSKIKSYFEYSTRMFLTLAIPAVIGLTLLSQPLLKIITTPEFLAGSELVLFIALGSIFFGIYQINVQIILLLKQTKWLPVMIATASLITIGLNLILIPRIGLIGSAIANLASFFVLAFMVSIWANKALVYNIDYKYVVKIIISATIMGGCVWLFKAKDVTGIIFSILIGIVVYGVSLILIKAFSPQDKQLIRETIRGLIPWKR